MAFLRFSLIFCALFVFQCQANVVPAQPEAVGDEFVDVLKGIIDSLVNIVTKALTSAEGMADYAANDNEKMVANITSLLEMAIDNATTILNRVLDGIKPDVSPDAVAVIDCIEHQEESVKQLGITTMDSLFTSVQSQSVAVFSDIDEILKVLVSSQGQIQTIDTTLLTCTDIPCLLQQVVAMVDVMRGIPAKIHDDVAKLVDDDIAAIKVVVSWFESNLPTMRDGIRLIFNNFATCARS